MIDTTSNSRITLGQKAQFTEKIGSRNSMEIKADRCAPSITVFCKNKGGISSTETLYVRVNFKSVKKKDAYKKINKILGD